MSLNQVINGVDEIITGTPKYNITDNGDGTKGIELANEIVQQGTPIAKQVLDKIDNVLSYLTPSVEKEGTPSEKTSTIKFMPTTWNELTQYKEYESSYTMPSGEIGNVKIYSLDGVYSNSYPVYYAFDNSNSTQFRLSKSKNLIIEFDEPIKINEIKTIVENASFYIDGSIDGINYVENLAYGTTQSQTEITLTLNDSNYYKYYRFRNVYGADQYTKIINIEFSNYTYHSTIYQNQFTLDNNGTTFTNNQRVLVETPNQTLPIIKDIFKGKSSNDETQFSNTEYSAILEDLGNDKPVIYYKVKQLKLNGTKLSSWSKTNIDDYFNNDSLTTNFDLLVNNSNYDNYVYFDLKQKRTGTLNYAINDDSSNNYIKIGYSDDGINWTYKSTEGAISPTNKTYNFNSRYIGLFSLTTQSGWDSHIYNIHLTNVDTLERTQGMTTDGVTSNTLNGIDIDTLLKPSTKYELIYKEDINKFELGGAKTLYDITLTQPVNQVDLTGISNMIKDGIEYELIISNANRLSLYAMIFLNVTSYIPSSVTYVKVYFVKHNDYITLITYSGNGYFKYENGTISNNFNIRNVTLNVGTRIIIKEVA